MQRREVLPGVVGVTSLARALCLASLLTIDDETSLRATLSRREGSLVVELPDAKQVCFAV